MSRPWHVIAQCAALSLCFSAASLPAMSILKPDQKTKLGGLDWVPCVRDPDEAKRLHCSEQYRLCREAGTVRSECLALPTTNLRLATAPSIDERAACSQVGNSDATCADIFSAYASRAQ